MTIRKARHEAATQTVTAGSAQTDRKVAAEIAGGKDREVKMTKLSFEPGTPHVGIFWHIQTSGTGPMLLVDSVPVEQAEIYGDFRDHGGHYKFWKHMARLSAPELRKRNLPDVAAWSEYEEWPRGRLVYHVPTGRFVLYADRKLQTVAMVKQIVQQFGLPADRVDVRGDEHYVSVR